MLTHEIIVFQALANVTERYSVEQRRANYANTRWRNGGQTLSQREYERLCHVNGVVSLGCNAVDYIAPFLEPGRGFEEGYRQSKLAEYREPLTSAANAGE